MLLQAASSTEYVPPVLLLVHPSQAPILQSKMREKEYLSFFFFSFFLRKKGRRIPIVANASVHCLLILALMILATTDE